MSTASVTNTFVNAATADAGEVNTNFSDLVTFLNGSVVHTDGSKAFTGVQTGVTPTSATHLATKGYVDGLGVGGTVLITSAEAIPSGSATTISWDASSQSGGNYWAIGSPTVLTADGSGWYLIWGEVFWATSAGSGGTYRKVILKHEGTSIAFNYAPPAAGLLQQVTGLRYLIDGDEVLMQVEQDSGVSKDVAASGTLFGMVRLSYP